jgi:hypothetical protein
MKSYTKRYGTIFAIGGILGIMMSLVVFISPSQQQIAYALDFGVNDFDCIAPVGNIGENICSEQDKSTTNHGPVDYNTNYNTYLKCLALLEQENDLPIDQSNGAQHTSEEVDQDNGILAGQANKAKQCTVINPQG